MIDRAPEDILREEQEAKILVVEAAKDKISIEKARLAFLEQRLRKAVAGCLRAAVDALPKAVI